MAMPPWEVKCSDNRRAVVEIGGNINGLPLPEEGEYEFVLMWNGAEIAHRRLVALRMGREGENQYGDPTPFEGYDRL